VSSPTFIKAQFGVKMQRAAGSIRPAAPNARPATRSRESRPRRTSRTTSSRGDPSEPPLITRPLSREIRELLRREIDRRVRAGLADPVRDKAVFRAVQAWGSAGVVA
jgi:hypothetical protein